MSVLMKCDKYSEIDLCKCPHILIGGSTGSGKSYLMKSLLCDVLASEECRVLVVDPKCVDYRFLLRGTKSYAGRSGLRYEFTNGKLLYGGTDETLRWDGRWKVSNIVQEDYEVKSMWSRRGIDLLDRDDIESGYVGRFLGSVVEEMSSRYKYMREYGYVDWSEVLGECKAESGDIWDSIDSGDGEGVFTRHRIVVVVDELADLIYWDRDRQRVVEGEISRESLGVIESMLVKIATLGRAAGIHLILGTQRPDASVLSGQLRANIPSRICLKVVNNMERRIILGDSCRDLGERVLFYNGEYKELVRELK